MDVLPDSTYIQHLHNLLNFLAEWENSPKTLTQMAYWWCFATSKKLGELDQGRVALENRLSPHRPGSSPQGETVDKYADLLLMALKMGFRQFESGDPDYPPTTLYHEWIFDVLFSCDDDEVIADALCAWVGHLDRATFSSCARHLIGRVEKAAPFSPRLQRTIVHAIEYVRARSSEVGGSELEAARLLNHLDLHVDGRY